MNDRISYPEQLEVSLALESAWTQCNYGQLSWEELEEMVKKFENIVENHRQSESDLV